MQPIYPFDQTDGVCAIVGEKINVSDAVMLPQGKHGPAEIAVESWVADGKDRVFKLVNGAYVPFERNAGQELPLTMVQNAAQLNEDGMVLMKKGKYKDAREVFIRAADLDPGNALYPNNAGFAYYKRGQYDFSIRKWFGKAIQIDPKRAIAYLNRGDAIARLDRYASSSMARKDYERFLELAPDSKAAPEQKNLMLCPRSDGALRAARPSSLHRGYASVPPMPDRTSTEAKKTSIKKPAPGKHFLSDKVEHFTESVIREMTRQAMLHGAVNLAQGFPDFPAPAEIKQAAQQAVAADVNQYAITWGAKNLRNAIARQMGVWQGITVDPEKEITVCCGSTEAMISTLLAVCNTGDEVVIFEPFYENYGPDSVLSGAKPKFVKLRPPQEETGDWTFDEKELRRAFDKHTKAIILNTPNNPTGKSFSRAGTRTDPRPVR